MEESKNLGRSRARSPNVLVPVVGLVYTDLYFVYLVLTFLAIGQFPGFLLILFPFALAFVGGAVGIWRGSRWGYIVAIISSVLLIILEGSFVLDSIASPADFNPFFGSITAIPALIAAVVYSISGLRTVWRKSPQMTPTAVVPKSSLLAVLILGFALGGLAVGLAAGQHKPDS